jgi:hypothetical protein
MRLKSIRASFLQRPPSLFLMRPLFFFGHALQFIGGISKDTIQDAAPDIFTVLIASVRQGNHLLHEVKRLKDVLVAGFQGWTGSYKNAR